MATPDEQPAVQVTDEDPETVDENVSSWDDMTDEQQRDVWESCKAILVDYVRGFNLPSSVNAPRGSLDIQKLYNLTRQVMNNVLRVQRMQVINAGALHLIMEGVPQPLAEAIAQETLEETHEVLDSLTSGLSYEAQIKYYKHLGVPDAVEVPNAGMPGQ